MSPLATVVLALYVIGVPLVVALVRQVVLEALPQEDWTEAKLFAVSFGFAAVWPVLMALFLVLEAPPLLVRSWRAGRRR